MGRRGIVTTIAVLAMLFATPGIAAVDGETISASPDDPASSETMETGQDLLRGPKNKASFNANYRFLGKGNVNLGILYVGKRDDVYYDSSTWQSVRVGLDSYTLVNLAASYDLTEHMQISGRVDNVFDEDYEEVYGYGTPGLSAYTGIRVSL